MVITYYYGNLSSGFLCYLSVMIRNAFFLLILLPVYAFGQSDDSYIMGKTVGNLPNLEYGLGSDRLGGAKMTYLDTGIVMKVVDSTVVNYRVQLSKNHFAYLDKSGFQRDDNIKIQPYYLTSSWMVNGDNYYDYVSVALDERLPYSSLQQVNPSRIVVNVYGVTSNTNWITQRSSAEEIKNAYYEQVEDDVFRITIELKHPQHWGYTISYKGNRLVIRVKRQPEILELKNLRIAVDAGHGGDNFGARGGRSGILEKKYTLLIAKELEKSLANEGAEVFMTRNEDVSLSMLDRINMLEKHDPDFLVSIHLNSSVNDSIKGVSTYYRYIGFRPLSQYILESMVHLGLTEFGNVGGFNFALNGPTDYPNCLVEVAFLSNWEDEQLILDPEFHKAVACQITDGIKKWLSAIKNDTP